MQEETGSPENRSSWRDVVARLAAEVALREGCEIYDIEFIGAGGNRALRILSIKLMAVVSRLTTVRMFRAV